jgi:hypothetical protein
MKKNMKQAAATAAHATAARSSRCHVVWVVAVLPASTRSSSCCTSTTNACVSPASGTGGTATVGPALINITILYVPSVSYGLLPLVPMLCRLLGCVQRKGNAGFAVTVITFGGYIAFIG